MIGVEALDPVVERVGHASRQRVDRASRREARDDAGQFEIAGSMSEVEANVFAYLARTGQVTLVEVKGLTGLIVLGNAYSATDGLTDRIAEHLLPPAESQNDKDTLKFPGEA